MTDSPYIEPRHAPPAPVEPPSAHEETDVDTRALGRFLAIMIMSLVVVGGVVYWQYRRFERLARENDPAPLPRADERKAPPPPNLQVNEVADIRKLRTEQVQLLERLEWVDPQAGRVRIPIERALEISARDGLRRWPAPPLAPAAASPAPGSNPSDEPSKGAPSTGQGRSVKPDTGANR